MHSVVDAQTLILQHVRPLSPQIAPLSSETLGLVLAEDIASDLDMPPYDKAMMDGYAVRREDFTSGQANLTVVEEIAAGQVPQCALQSGQASRIMTGAPIPQGADAVVMVERTELQGDRVTVTDSPRERQHILPRGQEMRQGETILPVGTMLRPQEFGLLAAVGRTAVRVFPRPQVAILSTGDEVVEPVTQPGPGQIRNSNGNMLVALTARAGALPRYLGIARDRLDSLEPLVAEGLHSDVLVLSGGVSAGKRDLVPEVLERAGVVGLLHKVAMKPGKPAFFGTWRRGANEGDKQTAVFGLPGNPVSSLVCFELFVRPVLRRLRNLLAEPQFVDAVLTQNHPYRSDRPTYHPAFLHHAEGQWRVAPVPWFGSADLRGLTAANALMLLPPGDHQHQAGQVLPTLSLE